MGAYAPIYHMLHEQTVPWCPVKCKCPSKSVIIVHFAGVLLSPKLPQARRATWPENLLAIQIFNWPDYFSISRPL